MKAARHIGRLLQSQPTAPSEVPKDVRTEWDTRSTEEFLNSTAMQYLTANPFQRLQFYTDVLVHLQPKVPGKDTGPVGGLLHAFLASHKDLKVTEVVLTRLLQILSDKGEFSHESAVLLLFFESHPMPAVNLGNILESVATLGSTEERVAVLCTYLMPRAATCPGQFEFFKPAAQALQQGHPLNLAAVYGLSLLHAHVANAVIQIGHRTGATWLTVWHARMSRAALATWRRLSKTLVFLGSSNDPAVTAALPHLVMQYQVNETPPVITSGDTAAFVAPYLGMHIPGPNPGRPKTGLAAFAAPAVRRRVVATNVNKISNFPNLQDVLTKLIEIVSPVSTRISTYADIQEANATVNAAIADLTSTDSVPPWAKTFILPSLQGYGDTLAKLQDRIPEWARSVPNITEAIGAELDKMAKETIWPALNETVTQFNNGFAGIQSQVGKVAVAQAATLAEIQQLKFLIQPVINLGQNPLGYVVIPAALCLFEFLIEGMLKKEIRDGTWAQVLRVAKLVLKVAGNWDLLSDTLGTAVKQAVAHVTSIISDLSENYPDVLAQIGSALNFSLDVVSMYGVTAFGSCVVAAIILRRYSLVSRSKVTPFTSGFGIHYDAYLVLTGNNVPIHTLLHSTNTTRVGFHVNPHSSVAEEKNRISRQLTEILQDIDAKPFEQPHFLFLRDVLVRLHDTTTMAAIWDTKAAELQYHVHQVYFAYFARDVARRIGTANGDWDNWVHTAEGFLQTELPTLKAVLLAHHVKPEETLPVRLDGTTIILDGAEVVDPYWPQWPFNKHIENAGLTQATIAWSCSPELIKHAIPPGVAAKITVLRLAGVHTRAEGWDLFEYFPSANTLYLEYYSSAVATELVRRFRTTRAPAVKTVSIQFLNGCVELLVGKTGSVFSYPASYSGMTSLPATTLLSVRIAPSAALQLWQNPVASRKRQTAREVQLTARPLVQVPPGTEGMYVVHHIGPQATISSLHFTGSEGHQEGRALRERVAITSDLTDPTPTEVPIEQLVSVQPGTTTLIDSHFFTRVTGQSMHPALGMRKRAFLDDDETMPTTKRGRLTSLVSRNVMPITAIADKFLLPGLGLTAMMLDYRLIPDIMVRLSIRTAVWLTQIGDGNKA